MLTVGAALYAFFVGRLRLFARLQDTMLGLCALVQLNQRR